MHHNYCSRSKLRPLWEEDHNVFGENYAHTNRTAASRWHNIFRNGIHHVYHIYIYVHILYTHPSIDLSTQYIYIIIYPYIYYSGVILQDSIHNLHIENTMQPSWSVGRLTILVVYINNLRALPSIELHQDGRHTCLSICLRLHGSLTTELKRHLLKRLPVTQAGLLNEERPQLLQLGLVPRGSELLGPTRQWLIVKDLIGACSKPVIYMDKMQSAWLLSPRLHRRGQDRPPPSKVPVAIQQGHLKQTAS